jgi:hypothetical protein
MQVCTPFNVLIQPSSSAGQYQVLLDADAAVQQALQASVAGNVLSLGASGRFETSNPIKLTVRWGLEPAACDINANDIRLPSLEQALGLHAFLPPPLSWCLRGRQHVSIGTMARVEQLAATELMRLAMTPCSFLL